MTHVQHLARASALAAFLSASLFSLPTYASSLAEETPPSTAADEAATPSSLPASTGEPATPNPPLDGPTPSSTPGASDTPEPGVTETAVPTPSSSEIAAGPTETESSTATTAPTSPDSTSTETPTPTITEDLPSPTDEATPTITDDPPFATDEATPTITEDLPLPTDEATASPTVSPTETPPSTATATPTTSLSPTPSAITPEAASFLPGSVLINEVAWAGTEASPSDEWLELWNTGADPIPLDGWRLADGGDIDRTLSGVIAGYGFFLMERTDDTTVADVDADVIYTGSLANGGERLTLLDPAGQTIDTANAAGGAWPAGSTSPRASMERHGALDLPGSWATFAGVPFAHDADGGLILGTPRQPNSPTLPTATATITATASPTATPTATLTPTLQPGGTPFPQGALRINEVAWAGTSASASDEWIELHNPGTEAILLEGWRLSDGGDIEVALSGTIAAGGYFLLERTDDSTVVDVAADQIYSGSLSNSGEALALMDPTGSEIDAANGQGGAWPAGNLSTHASMERAAGGGWLSFTGFYGVGRDADGNPIQGTPRAPNSVLFPTPSPTWIPGRVVINEVLMRPHYDWEGAGGVTTADEFIELYNRGPHAVNLRGWILDDYVVGGSKAYVLPSITLGPGEYVALYRSRTHIALNDEGDSIRLSAPDGSLVDKVKYRRVRAYNLSYGRLPDGDDVLKYGLWPTPGNANRLFIPTTSFAPGAVLINEVAWAGTSASANDEWIELYNPGAASVWLEGWKLSDGGDLEIDLYGVIPAGGYFLLERTDESTISDVAADLVYTGGLSNAGEPLSLTDPSGAEIDAANRDGGPWPAGSASGYASMERSTDDGWTTAIASQSVGHDAAGNPIAGTPRAVNSVLLPEVTATPTAIAGLSRSTTRKPGFLPPPRP